MIGSASGDNHQASKTVVGIKRNHRSACAGSSGRLQPDWPVEIFRIRNQTINCSIGTTVLSYTEHMKWQN